MRSAARRRGWRRRRTTVGRTINWTARTCDLAQMIRRWAYRRRLDHSSQHTRGARSTHGNRLAGLQQIAQATGLRGRQAKHGAVFHQRAVDLAALSMKLANDLAADELGGLVSTGTWSALVGDGEARAVIRDRRRVDQAKRP